APLYMVVGVVLAVLGVDAAEQEVAGSGALHRRHPVRDRTRQRSQDHVLDVRMRLGVATDRRPRVLDIDDAAGTGDDANRTIAAGIDRDVVGSDMEEAAVAGSSGDNEGRVYRPPRLVVGIQPVA